LIGFLKRLSAENKAQIWRDIAKYLSRPRQQRATVNVSQLNRYTKNDETAVVPGKVLGAGIMDHPITVAAFNFSDQARSKILAVNGRCLTIPELLEEKPGGANIKIIK
jgi:large subunit ribosomal protein L18e